MRGLKRFQCIGKHETAYIPYPSVAITFKGTLEATSKLVSNESLTHWQIQRGGPDVLTPPLNFEFICPKQMTLQVVEKA